MTGQDLSEGYLKIPDRLNMGAWVVDRHVREGRGPNPAVHVGHRTYTYEEIRRLSNRAGNALRGLGVKQGDCMVLRLGTNLDCMLAFLGALKIGAVPIPTSAMLRAQEVGIILRNSEAVAAIVTPDLAEAVEAVRGHSPRFAHLLLVGEAADPTRSWRGLMERASEDLTPAATAPNDPAFMMYTSGTTGEPKGVLHGHRWIIGTGDPITRVMTRLGPGDICFQPQDWSFIYPLGCNFLYPFHAGAAVVLPTGRFDPEQAFATVERYRVTVFCAVPTIYRMMLAVPEAERRYRLGSLRMGVSAGEPLPADTFKEWQEQLGVTIYDGIGQTESHIFLANRVGTPIKPGSMGKPLPGYEVAILDDEGKSRPVGEPGHLVIRNDHPGLTLGYYRDPERWAQVNQAGWYYTKDYASVDEDGYYWYVSRSDDLIKSRAYLISPKEVESAILEHPAVLEAGVVGVPDQLIGQRVKAYVTLKPGHAASPALADQIKEHTRRLIAPYKAPQDVEFVAELPKTLTGKILRRQLREKA
ncbi:MAG: acyl-CoA synthetase [Candidatus Rokubacteria bacterium]|nr:acyl-CoA synthetase [Candidatus Rokubacteria bacterium]